MTDVQALERYAATGDPDAFRHLVTCYQRLVYAACARRLRNDSDIEDAVQETFVKLAQHAGRIKTSVSGWLYTAATRVCLDRLRRDQTRRRHELAWRPEAGDNHAEHYGQLMLAVDDALAELPEAQRDLIVQYFLEGKTQTALAQEAGVTQSAVARRVERAVKELRATLNQRGVAASAAALGAFFAADAAQAQVPAVLTASLTKLGLSGAGAAATGAASGATSGGGVLATLTQAALPVKLAAGVGLAGVIGAGAVVMQPETPEAAATPTAAATVSVIQTAESASADSFAALAGTWEGESINAGQTLPCVLRFDGERVQYHEPPSGLQFAGTITRLDPDADPGVMEVQIEEANFPQIVGQPYRAIYRLHDDGTLEIATRDPGVDAERPDGFGRAGTDGVIGIEVTRRVAPAPVATDAAFPAADHGLMLFAVQEDETLALVRDVRLNEQQVLTAPMTIILGLMQTLQETQIEPTGNVVARYAPTEVDEDGAEHYPQTIGIPVAWEEDVPAPYAVKTLPAFHGVGYTYIGDVIGMATMFDRVFEQAAFEGHELTGRSGLETLMFEGPMSERNRFVILVETVPVE